MDGCLENVFHCIFTQLPVFHISVLLFVSAGICLSGVFAITKKKKKKKKKK